MYKLGAVTILLFLAAAAHSATPVPRAIHEEIEPGYQSYSLFLVCDPSWLREDRSRQLIQLYNDFKYLGTGIGYNHAAIWFWTIPGSEHLSNEDVSDVEQALNVDVMRSATYCDFLNLPVSKGPYIVITHEHPNLYSEWEFAHFEFANSIPSKISEFIVKLTDQIITSQSLREIKEAFTTAPADAYLLTRYWISFLEETRQSLRGAGCSVEMGINTAVLDVTIRECKEETPDAT